MRLRNRFALTSLLVTARTRLAVRALPGVIRILAPIVAWAALTIGLGAIVGFAAVALPPLGAFGMVAAVGVVLLWVMPEVPLVFPTFIRKTFFVMLIADLCVPYYYTAQFGDFALDLDPKSCDFLLSCSNAVRRGVFIRGSATHCRPRSLVSADCRLCGRLSCHGNRVHSWGRTSGIVPIWRS